MTGKFSLQMELRERFQKEHYKVGQLATEPYAALWGIDEVCPIGYNSALSTSVENLVLMVNDMLWKICKKNPDIIITGTQASVLPTEWADIGTYPLVHQIFLQAIRPDALIVCFNPEDSVKTVIQTMRAAEGITGGSIIGLVCYPLKLQKSWLGDQRSFEKISSAERQQIRDKIKENSTLSVFMLDEPADMDLLYVLCKRFFMPNRDSE